MSEIPSDFELDAYVDGQLDLKRRLVVEDYLARHPDIAARVIGDMRAKSALQLLFGRSGESGAGTQRRKWRGMPMFAAVSAGIAVIGAMSFLALTAPPDYVSEAVASHRVAMMRAAMISQRENPDFDAREIVSATKIAMPSFPIGWRVTDVQVFPSDEGSALQVAVRSAAGVPLSIFAIRQRSRAPENPDAVREGVHSVAYWRGGDISYALTGEGEPNAIDATAEELNRFWKF